VVSGVFHPHLRPAAVSVETGPTQNELPELFAPQEEEPAEAAPGGGRQPWEFGPITQLFHTYLVYESAEGVVFVDQHSAHERVLYEQVMARLAGGGLPGQRLLLPVTVDLTDEELEVIEQYGEVIGRVGFEVEPFGGRTVALHAVPTPHPRFDATRCFQELVADLARGRFGGWANRLERFGATFACRAAVKAGDALDERERRELLARLFACALPPHDVHGRATIVQLPREELERRFGRR
jgi:DNA mismatch repair protein MutL